MVILTSNNCDPCKTLKRVYDQDSRVQFKDIESKDGKEIAKDMQVRTVPTLIHNGKTTSGLMAIMKELRQ